MSLEVDVSIRNLAQDLYRAQKQVEELEEKLRQLGESSPERAVLEVRFREAVAERDKLRKMLEEAKGK